MSICLSIALVVTIGWMAVSLLLSWENKRYCLVRLRKSTPVRKREHRTFVFLPCKGDDGDLFENLSAFFRQQHKNFQLCLIVESTRDPAMPVIRKVMALFPEVDSCLIVSGVASTEGQKVHNLRMATSMIPDDVKVLAFADADIRPGSNWLENLTVRICKHKNVTVNTGYRWMVPVRNSLANLLVASINAGIAGAMGSGGHLLAWGGSWAMRRSEFDRLGVRDAWKGTLSDDLVLSRIVQAGGGKVYFSPRCLATTYLDSTLADSFRFLRRQYLISRKYAGRLFWPGYFFLITSTVTWWALVSIVIFGSPVAATWSAVWAASIYVIQIIKAWMRQKVFLAKRPDLAQSSAMARRFDIFAGPIVMLANSVVTTVSLFGNQIRWRGNQYKILNNGQVETLYRDREFDQRPVILFDSLGPKKTQVSQGSSDRPHRPDRRQAA